MKGSSPVVELKLPVLPDMELSATKTAEIVAKHMELSEDKSDYIEVLKIFNRKIPKRNYSRDIRSIN